MTAFLDELFSLAGRVAVVTGGSSGIGRAIAGALGCPLVTRDARLSGSTGHAACIEVG